MENGQRVRVLPPVHHERRQRPLVFGLTHVVLAANFCGG
jgi:hypothetical protein